MSFKDHFSKGSEGYRAFRPDYPAALYAYLAEIAPSHDTAWDCAAGSGQSTIPLADYFSSVVATDASLSQIASARPHERISYRVATAEASGLEDGSVDLITVAQALHWFDIDAFSVEVARVLKPGGVVAAWTYNLLTITPPVDKLVNHLYGTLLQGYWPPERALVEEGYSGISLPFEMIYSPSFSMSRRWSLDHLLGYLKTWSAVSRYEENLGENPVDNLSGQLSEAWGESMAFAEVSWPLVVKVWRKAG